MLRFTYINHFETTNYVYCMFFTLSTINSKIVTYMWKLFIIRGLVSKIVTVYAWCIKEERFWFVCLYVCFVSLLFAIELEGKMFICLKERITLAIRFHKKLRNFYTVINSSQYTTYICLISLFCEYQTFIALFFISW